MTPRGAVYLVAFILLALVTNGTLALLLTPLAALGSVAGPAMQGIMSRTVGDDQQGELQGVLTSVNALAIIIAPIVMTRTFWYFNGPDAPINLPGAPFLLSAALTLVSILVFVLPRRSE